VSDLNVLALFITLPSINVREYRRESNFFDLKYEVMTCIDDIKTKQMIL